MATWLGPDAAHADDQEAAIEHYRAGRKAYDLGRFRAAIEHFERAYEAQPAPEFVFNIAQAHRQLGECKPAIFFYRRFLRLDPDSKIRAETEAKILNLEATCAPEPAAEAQAAGAAPVPIDGPSDSPPRASPRFLVVGIEAGLGIADLGDFDVPVQPSFRIGAAYPIELGPAELRLGALGTLLPVPYDRGTATLSQVLAQVELSFMLTSWLRLRGEAGAGVLLFSGLRDGNPFTVGGAPTSGPLGMLAVRVAAGVDVPISSGWHARLTALSFSFSPPKEGLDPSIARVLRFDATAGVGYGF